MTVINGRAESHSFLASNSGLDGADGDADVGERGGEMGAMGAAMTGSETAKKSVRNVDAALRLADCETRS